MQFRKSLKKYDKRYPLRRLEVKIQTGQGMTLAIRVYIIGPMLIGISPNCARSARLPQLGI
jgi:hypothetical protein